MTARGPTVSSSQRRQTTPPSDSMLNWTEHIIRMRKEVRKSVGRLRGDPVRDPAVLIIRYDWRNNSVLFMHNFDEKPREIRFPSDFTTRGASSW